MKNNKTTTLQIQRQLCFLLKNTCQNKNSITDLYLKL